MISDNGRHLKQPLTGQGRYKKVRDYRTRYLSGELRFDMIRFPWRVQSTEESIRALSVSFTSLGENSL